MRATRRIVRSLSAAAFFVTIVICFSTTYFGTSLHNGFGEPRYFDVAAVATVPELLRRFAWSRTVTAGLGNRPLTSHLHTRVRGAFS